MKNYKKNIISIVILLCIVLILYFTPPIMLAAGWIEFGSRADSFETHILDEYNNFPFRREASNSDFDNFYFINLRIWEKMSITRIVYNGDKNTTCELIFPGVYRVENTRKGAYVNSFEIKRGKTLWFCDYYANEM
ncbi:hypothetical protein DW256_04150 [Ruminococcus sp. AM22-14LB]|jgi:hypothetical protein|nr:hypothetical protein DW256_04150 [Ruminococcus sp. AM22-14LB]